jgi:hypothetical protein
LSFAFKGKSQVDKLDISFQTIDTTGTIELDVLKFYISNFNIQFFDGTDTTLENAFYLIDFSDDSSSFIRLKNGIGLPIKAINFSIGTDSITNVSGAFDGALDPIHGMFWTWNSGYINVKMEGILTISKKSEDFQYHIGGYSGENKTIRDVHLAINETKESTIQIEIDLNNFVDNIDMSKTNHVMSPGIKAALLATYFAESFHVVK